MLAWYSHSLTEIETSGAEPVRLPWRDLRDRNTSETGVCKGFLGLNSFKLMKGGFFLVF